MLQLGAYFKSFYSKLVLSLLVSFSIIALILMLLVQQLTRTYQSEVEQKLHVSLAAHIVHDDGLLKDGKVDQKALEAAFHSMMVLGPSFEFYVISPMGTVTTYSADDNKIKRMQVNLAPIKQFLADNTALPILGDDPRSPYRQKIFSVAEIKDKDQLHGYLYIIIGGEIYDSVVDLLKESHIVELGFWGFAATLFFSLIVVLLLFSMLTRPLRKLALDMRHFREEGFERAVMPDSHWDPLSADEIHRLGTTFHEMASALKQQYEQVRTTDQLRRELISYVSHDLRTPLAALQGYLETWQLKQQEISVSEGAELINTAMENAQHISRLVEQLFELAHLDAANAQLTLEPVAMAELAHDVSQKLQLDADKKRLKFDIQPQDPSFLVMANIEKLERVFTNLLENAIRHSDQGGTISIVMARQQGAITITIKDQGCGIPEDELSHIFEAHFRASNSAKGGRAHSGLGLAITHRILELHSSSVGGEVIHVESHLGQGSAFTFSLKTA